MAGAGYKLFNSGDVLTAAQVNTYLMEQTVMVFNDAAARTTALSGVLSEGMISYLKDTNAVEVYNGSAWVASDDPNAIQNTIVDAKGDLISATAADTPARLASSGVNGDILTVDTSTATGLKWAAPAASSPLTTKGDLYTYSTTNARLGVGANNTFLVADSGETTGLKYSTSRWVTLASGSLSGTEVSLSGFSSAYDTLRLEIYNPQTATSSVPVSIRFNSDSGNNYEGVALQSASTAIGNYASGAALLPMFGNENCPTSANTYSMCIEISRYNDTVRKFITGFWNQTDNFWGGGHNFNSTTAITSIQIRLNGTATWSGGTYVLRGI